MNFQQKSATQQQLHSCTAVGYKEKITQYKKVFILTLLKNLYVMSLQIIGTGMGRTGTHSLKLALEQLGFGKCYHMAELFQHPEGLVHFEKAEKGEDADWDTLFEGYNSAVDYPVTRYYKQLMQRPVAKQLLTLPLT